MQYRIHDCIVLDKLQSGGRYGNFYMVMKDVESGKTFDLIISATTFSQKEVGDHVYFKLREFDIQQTLSENILYFFGPTLLIVAGFVAFVGSLIYFNRC